MTTDKKPPSHPDNFKDLAYLCANSHMLSESEKALAAVNNLRDQYDTLEAQLAELKNAVVKYLNESDKSWTDMDPHRRVNAKHNLLDVLAKIKGEE